MADIDDIEKELKQNLLKLQELALDCFKIKATKVQEKHQIIKLIYQFRYYCSLPYNLRNNIFEIEKLQNSLNEAGIMLIKKAVEQKVIVILSNNENINYEIIKNIFNLRIINLEDLSLKIVKENEGYFVQFFDDKAYDKKCKINIDSLNNKMLSIRINKKVRLFE